MITTELKIYSIPFYSMLLEKRHKTFHLFAFISRKYVILVSKHSEDLWLVKFFCFGH